MVEVRNFEPVDSKEVQDIFWRTSALQSFSSAEKKLHFQYKYLDHYLQNPEAINLVALTEGKVGGYILSTTAFPESLLTSMSYLHKFSEYWIDFPAHLHINCSPEFQGRGVGSILLRRLEEVLTEKAIPGVHLLTSPGHRNIQFYQKNGYHFSHEIEGILFLGKSL